VSNVASSSYQPNVSELEFKLEAVFKENTLLCGQNNELSLELERYQAMEATCTECFCLQAVCAEVEAKSIAVENSQAFYRERVRVVEDLA
jgi:hypothetical protein